MASSYDAGIKPAGAEILANTAAVNDQARPASSQDFLISSGTIAERGFASAWGERQ